MTEHISLNAVNWLLRGGLSNKADSIPICDKNIPPLLQIFGEPGFMVELL